MYYPYKLESQEDLYRLSEMACQEDFNIYISTNSEVLDTKSLLALFSALGKEVRLVAPDHVDSSKFNKFIEKLTSTK